MYDLSEEMTLTLINCMVFAKVRERLAVSKQEAQNFDGERFNLGKVNEVEVTKQYKFKISHRFTAMENLNISRT